MSSLSLGHCLLPQSVTHLDSSELLLRLFNTCTKRLIVPIKHIDCRSAFATHTTQNRRAHSASCGAARSKRHISKSCAISVAIATYLYVTQTANGHLSPIVVCSSKHVFKLCVHLRITVSLDCSKYHFRSNVNVLSSWFLKCAVSLL